MMPERLTYTRETVRYAVGHDFHDACQRVKDGSHETPQAAYDSLGYWEEREEGPWDVFEFKTVDTVEKVEPPYSSR